MFSSKFVAFSIVRFRVLFTKFSYRNFVMSKKVIKTASDSVVDSPPTKKIKFEPDTSSGGKRTVATMCGAWRRDEVDGGLIFVFPKRNLGLSPDPRDESDYPENIQDFWDGTWQAIESTPETMQEDIKEVIQEDKQVSGNSRFFELVDNHTLCTCATYASYTYIEVMYK